MTAETARRVSFDESVAVETDAPMEEEALITCEFLPVPSRELFRKPSLTFEMTLPPVEEEGEAKLSKQRSCEAETIVECAQRMGRAAAYAAIALSTACVTLSLLNLAQMNSRISVIRQDLSQGMNEFDRMSADIWHDLMDTRGKTAASTHKAKRQTQDGLDANGECHCSGNNLCPAGPSGRPGTPGLDGTPGHQGEPGSVGAPAANVFFMLAHKSECRKCPEGPRGPPGLPGNPGESGRAGPPGSPGTTGKPGTSGSPGGPGDNGPDGPQGAEGPPGPRGEEGVLGEPGDPGEPGEPGPPGQPGFTGFDGEPGKHGKQGETGPVGEPGHDGAAGSPGGQGGYGPPGPPGDDGKYCHCPVRHAVHDKHRRRRV